MAKTTKFMSNSSVMKQVLEDKISTHNIHFGLIRLNL